MYEYGGTVKKVIDGDTVLITVDLGFRIYFDMPIRLYGIDTPELHSKDADEKLKATNAKVYVEKKIDGKRVTVKTKMEQEKYGRWLADIYYEENKEIRWLNSELITQGYAKSYFGGKKEK